MYTRRWQVEVTFEEVRAHLGVETQRQWNDLAIARTTPVLLGLFSLVTLLAHQLHRHSPGALTVRAAALYMKPQATFSDALACVRDQLWRVFRCHCQEPITKKLQLICSITLPNCCATLSKWIKSSLERV